MILINFSLIIFCLDLEVWLPVNDLTCLSSGYLQYLVFRSLYRFIIIILCLSCTKNPPVMFQLKLSAKILLFLIPPLPLPK